MSIINELIKNPQYLLTSPGAKGYLDWVPDSLYLRLLYRSIFHQKLNLKNPVRYNEKLQWLKLHDRKPEYSQMVDKYEVRSYISNLLGPEYLIPCLGVYNSFDEIDFDSLPDRFVIKCTHDSGSVIVCKNKAKLDLDESRKSINKSLKRNYYSAYREWPYKNVKPRIIIEQYMEDDSNGDLKDYKIMCFDGKALIIENHENRFVDGLTHTQTFYNRDWNILDISQPGLVPRSTPAERPKELEQMLKLSEILSANIKHVRIDWYLINGNIYFGEITFYDGSGLESFDSAKMELMLGNLININ